MELLYKRLAATYFSTNKCSIIGDVRLLPGSVRRHGLRARRANFTLSAEPTPSARNGKRCGMPSAWPTTELHSHQK